MSPLEQAVRRALAKLMTAFPNREIASIDQTVAVYLDVVRDVDPIDVDGGVVRAIRSEARYFPTPATLRGYAMEERTARTVMVRPLVHIGEDVLCTLCGATKLWDRQVENARGTFFRYEVLHASHCALRRPDQGMMTITMGAA